VKPVLVLGTPCTGTAEIARAIGLLGALLGRPESVGKFSENKELRRINQALLDVLPASRVGGLASRDGEDAEPLTRELGRTP